MKKPPIFTTINLKRGRDHRHPDIKPDGKTYYLAKVWGSWYFGTFEEEWFGLTFNCNFGACGHIQFDAPGYNGSQWTELYRMEKPDRSNQKKRS